MNPSPDRRPLRVGLAQVRPRKADVAGNAQRIRELVDGDSGAHDLLVFPEAALSGYFIEGGVAEAARSAVEVAALLGTPHADAPDVVLGFYERWRRRYYNAAGYFTPGEEGWRAVHVHRKLFLPTYGVFDEARFVETGSDLRAFDTRFGRMGMLVCEDMWHALPPTILALGGAEVILVVSASPARDFRPGLGGRPGNIHRWERLAPSTAVEHGVFVAVSQLVGSEGGKIFPGGSIAVDPYGEVLARGSLLEEQVVSACMDGAEIERARFDSPLLADLEQMLPHLRRALGRARGGGAAHGSRGGGPDGYGESAGAYAPIAEAPLLCGGEGPPGPSNGPSPEDTEVLALDLPLVERTLVHFIRDEVERRGFEKVVVGVSGGVDSAVSLFLAARALGPENVHAFRLPYATSSADSLDHAGLVLEALGVEGRTIEITGPVDAYVREHEPDISPLRKGNLMARVRAVVLFDQSAHLRALPLGTGNKSERLLGYFTWHADDSPPINPLGDLFKTQVWALARHMGVPDPIVDKPATADLVEGVTDEDEIGVSYRHADPILYWLLRGYAPAELVARGFEEERVDLVWMRLNGTHWKRELPTVAILSSSAIGEFYLRPVDY